MWSVRRQWHTRCSWLLHPLLLLVHAPGQAEKAQYYLLYQHILSRIHHIIMPGRLISLPDEIIGLICLALGADRDFSTLFNCALTATSIVDAALRHLYL